MGVIGFIWATKYENIAFLNSYRNQYLIDHNVNSTQQISYLLSHKKKVLVSLLNISQYLDIDLLFNSRDLYFNSFNSFYLMFLGSVCFMYPIKKHYLKTRIALLFIILTVYFGTYFTFLLNWTPVGQLNPIVGVQPRYFLPLFVLMPFIFSFNHMNQNEDIDVMVITLTISFLALMIISMICFYY